MTASVRLARTSSLATGRWLPPLALLAGLGAIVAARWWATRSGGDALLVGTAFGIALAGLALGFRPRSVARVRPCVPRLARLWITQVGHLSRSALVGLAFGLALVALTVAGPAIAGVHVVPGLGRPAAPFLPWALITILVASAEEAILRGVLFDGLRRSGGTVAAVLLTTAAFALMHVPLYGWHVVPLDLAVGIGLGGLRLGTGRVAAPASAHAVADLATWWM